MTAKAQTKSWLIRGAIILAVLIAGLVAWKLLTPKGLPEGIASGNGRIEAVEIDVSAKAPGRVLEVLVDEGDFVRAGQIVARMDTASLDAQRAEAVAELARARDSVAMAQSQVAQQQSSRAAAVAMVRQRQADLGAANRRYSRSSTLASEGATAVQERDDDQARVQGARAAVDASQAQVDAVDAAVRTAQSQVTAAQAAVAAVEATIRRIDSEIADCTLRAPRDGRVQYRVAQPGEVVGAGGRIVNLVDLSDVYMTFFLPETVAGRVQIGSEVRIVLDTAPDRVIPARVSFVADVAQFTPKTVETQSERQKLMFRVKAQIDPALLRRYITQVKTGVPGMAYVRVAPDAQWPVTLTTGLVR